MSLCKGPSDNIHEFDFGQTLNLSLQQALYEPAVDYYTSHSKRVRRKRNRHTHGSSVGYPAPAVSSVPVTRPLRPEGWTVRYEYKMACFAEFRGEDEVALKYVPFVDSFGFSTYWAIGITRMLILPCYLCLHLSQPCLHVPRGGLRLKFSQIA